MTEYLGIGFVVIVVSLCIGILSRICTEGILDEIRKYKKKRGEELTEELTKVIANSIQLIEPMIEKQKAEQEKRRKEFNKSLDELDKFAKELETKTTKTTRRKTTKASEEAKE